MRSVIILEMFDCKTCPSALCKSAWFMGHRIRYTMTQSPLFEKLYNIVEADETYVGGKARGKRGRGAEIKQRYFP